MKKGASAEVSMQRRRIAYLESIKDNNHTVGSCKAKSKADIVKILTNL